MKAIRQILLLIIFLQIFTGLSFAQEQAGKIFEKALYLEESEGDLQKAISLYEKIVKEFGKEQEIAAKAQLHIGFCYEKLGRKEAVKAYETVVEKYSAQKEQVNAALTRLAELRKEPPKGLSVQKISGWDTPGVFIEPFEITPNGRKMIGVEMIKGQNIVMFDLETKKIDFITNHVWSREGYCWTYNPILSPNGKEIVYYSSAAGESAKPAGNNLIVSTLDGKSRIIASDTSTGFVPNAWLPDGSAVLIIKENKGEPHQLGLIPREGGDFKSLVSLQNANAGVGRTSAPSSSISPDGRYIVYMDVPPGEKADIYIISTDGGTPKHLFKHPAEDKQPRWSPDGKYITFLSMRHGSWALWGLAVKNGEASGEPFIIQDGMKNSYLLNWTKNGLASWIILDITDIYLIDVNPETGEPLGKPTQIDFVPTGRSGTPVWSPDGNSFAFLRGSDEGIFVVIVTGNQNREYSLPAGFNPSGLRWTSDGNTIGMVSNNKQGEYSLHRLNVISEEWQSTPITAGPGFVLFDWCAGDKNIYLTRSGKGIVELEPQTGTEKFLFQDTSAVVFRSLKCSRDHKKLAFLLLNKDLLLDIIVINLATNELHEAGTNFGTFSWSYDGQKLVSDMSFNPKGNKQALFIIPASGSHANEVNLSQYLPPESEILTPDWSPDGKKIIFMLRSRQSEVSLFRNILPLAK